MSTMSNDDIDAMFAEMTAGVEVEEVPDDEIVNVKEMSDVALIEWYNLLRKRLLSTGQLIHPTTDEARNLHSSLAACKVELITRKNTEDG